MVKILALSVCGLNNQSIGILEHKLNIPHSEGPHKGVLNFPGLAMSRAFGDLVASYVGVSAYPEIKETKLNENDAYIVIASDGVWEFLENKEVAEIIYEYYIKGNAEKAAEEVVREAYKRWRKNEVIIDDITCIVLFLDVKKD